MIIDLRPPQKVLKATTSKIKKAGASKRHRDSDDSDDVDYDPNLSEMAAASSVGSDLMGLDLESRQWTTESCTSKVSKLAP